MIALLLAFKLVSNSESALWIQHVHRISAHFARGPHGNQEEMFGCATVFRFAQHETEINSYSQLFDAIDMYCFFNKGTKGLLP